MFCKVKLLSFIVGCPKMHCGQNGHVELWEAIKKWRLFTTVEKFVAIFFVASLSSWMKMNNSFTETPCPFRTYFIIIKFLDNQTFGSIVEPKIVNFAHCTIGILQTFIFNQ